MPSVFIIEPDNNDLLTSLSQDPLLKELEIKHIQVDPQKRQWIISFKGSKKGPDYFWDEMKAKIIAQIPEIVSVEFAWESDNYMEEVVKKFPGPVSAPPPEPKPKNGGRNGGRRRLDASIKGEPIAIKEILEEERGVIIEGEIIAKEVRQTRTGKTLLTFDIYDRTDSITCKLFVDSSEDLPDVTEGHWFRIKGNIQYQAYEGELSMMVQQINQIESPPERTDDAKEKRVEFHLHTKMSSMDGLLDIEDAIAQAAKWGHEAIAITDHGVVQAFPKAYFVGKKHGIKILYGLEGYLLDEEKDYSYHIVLIAKNKQGLKNLYKLVSISHLKHFYYRPRIPRKVLDEHRQGLIVGSACEAGELYQAVLRNDPNREKIAAYYDYLEIQPLGNNEFLIGTEYVKNQEDLKRINLEICRLGEKLDRPVMATGDVHFLHPEDEFYRRILQAGQGYDDAERQAPLYFRTTDEMLEEFSYLGSELAYKVVVENPRAIASEVEDLVPIPQGLHPPIIEGAEEKVRELTYRTAHQIYGDPLPELVKNRLERELKAIIGNGYASLYWTAHILVKESLDNGYSVGSRGSVGSSLVATMCNITEVNPLIPHYICPNCKWTEFIHDSSLNCGLDLPRKDCPSCNTPLIKEGYNIPFEVFMGFHGDKVPDIDLNFSGEFQGQINKFTEDFFGADKVFRAGTIGTIADKTAYGFVMKYLEQTGGTRSNAEINRLVKKIVGVKRTTGQHPGGMIVVPADRDIYDFTPIQYPANDPSSGTVTTHFEYDYIHDSLVKLDNLGHTSPTMLKILEDFTGISMSEVPLDDPKTLSIFSGLDALAVTEEQIGTPVGTYGIPEFGTSFVRQMLIDTRPKTIGELISISGLSHGTDVWLNNAQELIRNKVVDFSSVIACRDDIMTYLIAKGLEPSDAFRIMEQVRKGRGLTDQDISLMKQFDVPDWYIDSCNKIKYLFPKAHAVAYVLSAIRIAYFKVHHPEAFYATFFSMEIENFDAQMIVQGESMVRRFKEELREKGNEATVKERKVEEILDVVIEAYVRGIRFAPIDLYRSDQRYFKILEDRTLLPPLASLQGVGINAAESIVTARKEGEFSSIEDLRLRSRVSKTVIEALRLHGCLDGMNETNQLTLF
ncbi:MAG: PolC-type DNA polymerase III [Firmicutes bacterium]|nr:PolC-type DNA polymerase III [Bacillota bacterium]